MSATLDRQAEADIDVPAGYVENYFPIGIQADRQHPLNVASDLELATGMSADVFDKTAE